MALTELFTPEKWVAAHQEEIYGLIGAFYPIFVASLREREPDSNTRFFSQDKRTFSEMPLCRSHMSIATQIGLPGGYFVVTGSVNTHGDQLGERSGLTHQFIATDKGSVIDFTGAQFVLQGEKPGDRTQRLKDLAGDLLTVFPNGLAVLLGQSDQISGKIGLDYNTSQLHPNRD